MTSEARVALVTGGGRGIGAAIVRALATAGLRVVINYHRSGDAAAALASALQGDGHDVDTCAADVADATAVRALLDFVRRRYGRLDVLVNNAGILHEGMLAFTSPEDFWRVMHVNLGGVMLTCRAATAMLSRHRAGRIINVSSVSAFRCTAGVGAYAASKAAVNALTAVLARELAPLGITVNAVAPGLVETDMTAAPRSPEAQARALAAQAVPRMGTPDEIAAVVRFLALDSPPYLTGQILRADGGGVTG